MAIGRITYTDKVDYQIQGEDSKYKITAKDMNEIKSVFNNSASAIETGLENIDSAVKKANASETNAKTSETNAKTYMNSAKSSAESVVNGLGLSVVDGKICMKEE